MYRFRLFVSSNCFYTCKTTTYTSHERIVLAICWTVQNAKDLTGAAHVYVQASIIYTIIHVLSWSELPYMYLFQSFLQ